MQLSTAASRAESKAYSWRQYEVMPGQAAERCQRLERLLQATILLRHVCICSLFVQSVQTAECMPKHSPEKNRSRSYEEGHAGMVWNRWSTGERIEGANSLSAATTGTEESGQ